MSYALLALRGLSKYYSSGQNVVMALSQVELSFSAGEFVAVTGESGSGKSTLAQVLGGILPYESGELLLNGRPTSHYDAAEWEAYRRDKVSFISQDYGILPGNTVLDNVVSALRLAGLSAPDARARAEAALRRVELWELRGRRAAKLSSGQKQRLSIARALAKPAPILIADEPTGNLDGENSAKVLSLLAEAARERLVILITHEFAEAEGLVTRRVSLQDGQVVRDVRLREPPSPAPSAGRPGTGRPKGLTPFLTAFQLKARPVWCALMLLFFSLTVFSLFAFGGTFLSELDDTPTRRYDPSAFRNGDDRRIVAVRADGADMTGADEALLLSVPHVEAAETYSYLADFQYAYVRDVHYRYRYTSGGTLYDEEEGYEIFASVLLDTAAMPFARTVPDLAGGGTFLTAGRLPETIYEVVAADPALLGKTFPVYVRSEKHWAIDAYLCLEVTVVGTTGYGTGLYFHDDLGRTLTAAILDSGALVYLPVYDGLDGQAMVSAQQYARFYKHEPEARIRLTAQDDPQDDSRVLIREVAGAIPSTLNSAVGVDPEDYHSLLYSGRGDQLSLYVEDYAYTGRVLERVRALGYAAISPYQEGSAVQDAALAGERMDTLTLCCAAFLAALALQVILLRAMFGLETGSYRLLSHIGLDCKTARRSLLAQVLLFTLCGQAAGGLAIALLGGLGEHRVVRLLRYLTPGHCAFLSLLHLAACLLTAFWAAHALQKQVFPHTGRAPDLDWDDGEVEP